MLPGQVQQAHSFEHTWPNRAFFQAPRMPEMWRLLNKDLEKHDAELTCDAHARRVKNISRFNKPDVLGGVRVAGAKNRVNQPCPTRFPPNKKGGWRSPA